MKNKNSRKYNKLVADETIEDYSLRYAPKSFRKFSELLIANTALGSISFLALEAIGASIAIQYGFNTAFWAILTASLIIFITAIPISYYAAKHNIDIDLITRSAGFGYVGSTFTSLIYASFSFIFFALEAAIMSQALELYFGLPLYLGYILSSIIIIPIVFYGITIINKLQLFTQPIWLTMMVAPFIAILVKDPNAFSIFSSMNGSISGSSEFNIYYFGSAIGISLSLIAQIGEQVDYLRFMPPLTKENRFKWWISMLSAGPGWIILGFLKQIGGIFLASFVLASGFSIAQAKTPIEMYNIGYTYIFDNPHTALITATVFVLISQIKINVTNAYAGSLAWSNFFSRITYSHPGRVVWMIFNIAIALLLMELGLFDVLSNILGLYSNVAIAWIGAIFADLVINKPFGLSPKIAEFKRAYLYNINPVGVGSMGIASVVSILAFMGLFGDIAQSYSSIIAMSIAIVLSPLIAYITQGKYYIIRENTIIKSEQTHYTCEICSHSYEKEDIAFCPLHNSHICSLCCTLDALCHDNCKTEHNNNLRKQIGITISSFFKNHISAVLSLKIFDFMMISLGLFFLISIIAWMSISMQVDSIEESQREIFISTIINYSVVMGIIMSVISWWILLLQDSRTRAEELLENEKESFKAIYNGTKDAIAIIDLDSHFIQVNPAYITMTGYTEEELLKTSCMDFTADEDKAEAKKALNQVINGGYLKNLEKQCKINNSQIISVNITMTLLHNPDRILMSVRDITQEKEAIKNFEYLLNNTIETIGIFQENICIDFNEAGLKLFGFRDKKEVLGKNTIDLISPRFHKTVKTHIQNNYTEPYEAEGIKKDGSIFPILIRGKKTIFKGIESRVTSIIDLSELKEKEKALKKAKIKAEEATKMKSDFLANMSHEIRTPMNGIMGMAHLALETDLNAKQKNFIEKIDSSAKNLLGILNDILDFSKVEAGKLEIEKINFNLEDTLQDIINLIQNTANEKNIQIKIEYDKNISKNIFADKLRLAQVLTNIISNAIKFTDTGSIEVHVSKKDNRIYRFEIKDTGIGLSDKQSAKLFNSFTQADGSTTRKYGGTGLGLAISKQLIELMNGKIWVESELGIGSNFIFELPIQEIQKDYSVKKVYRTKKDIMSLKGSSILLVEDNKINQEIITGLLDHSGINIDIADNGEIAILLFEQNEYELILMDIQMPIMDGYKATKIIREKDHIIPIIALTANAMKEDIEKSYSLGMNEHLNKPIEYEELYNVLLKYIDKKVSSIKTTKEEDTQNIQLPNFTTLDTKKGLHHLAKNKELYLKILQNFKLKYKDINFENMNNDTLYREIHTLNGLSANIGATELHKVTKKLNKTKDKSLINKLNEQLSKVLNELEEITNVEQNKLSPSLEINKEIQHELMEQLYNALLSNRPKNCETIFETISLYKLPQKESENIQNIKNLVKKYQFSQALNLMKEIL